MPDDKYYGCDCIETFGGRQREEALNSKAIGEIGPQWLLVGGYGCSADYIKSL